MIEDKGNNFYSFNGNLYKSDIVRACIRPKVQAIGKLIPQHILKSEKKFKINPNLFIKFMLEEPNPYMSGQVFQEKMAMQLALNNNAFALLVRDENGLPIEVYNIPCVTVECIYDSQGLLYFRFTNKNGVRVVYPYNDIIHIRRDFNENDIFGDSPREALLPLMEIVSTTDRGIINAIKNSNVIKWLLKFNVALKPEDIKKNVDDFTNSYLNIKNSGGAAGVDSKSEAIQVNSNDYVPNALQMDKTTQRIYSFFNVNEHIVQGKYTEDEWNAYYEIEIEPFAMQISNEYTRKIFNRKDRVKGNKIIFTANNLQYASMNTKLNLQAMVDRGAMTPNEWREVLNLPPIEGGDTPLRRLDTATINDGNTTSNEEPQGGDESNGNRNKR